MHIPKRSALALTLVVTLGSSAAASAFAQAPVIAPAKAALIRRLLELTKVAEVTVSTLEASIPGQRAANPQVPPEFWQEFVARARRDSASLVEALVPIYDAQFTTGQLEQLLRFYESPLGRHLLAVQPLIAGQSMQAGQFWGARLGSQIAEDLARRGVQMPRPR